MTEKTDTQRPMKLRRSQLPHLAEVKAADECGVYFIFDATGKLLYVGQSANVGFRVGQHTRNHFQFTRATWQPMAAEFLDEYESFYIFEFSPAFNKAKQARGVRVNNRLNRVHKSRPRGENWRPSTNSWGFGGTRYKIWDKQI